MERFSFSMAHVLRVTRWACIISCGRGESLHHLNVSWTSNTELLRSKSNLAAVNISVLFFEERTRSLEAGFWLCLCYSGLRLLSLSLQLCRS